MANEMIGKPVCRQERMALRDSLELLGGKWKLLIVNYLSRRPSEANNFKKIQFEMDGISAKMLSKELKELEQNLLVTREVHATKPVTVTYALTEYGFSTVPITALLIQWGAGHREKIKSEL